MNFFNTQFKNCLFHSNFSTKIRVQAWISLQPILCYLCENSKPKADMELSLTAGEHILVLKTV